MKQLILLCLIWWALPALAHEEHTKPQKSTLAVSVVFDAQHRLWRASVKSGQVLVDSSSDKGKTFSAPVIVNVKPEKIGAEGELRPKIALGLKGEIYVSWTQALEKPYAGDIRFSRSLDGGRSFSTPIVVNHNRDLITHRFDSLVVTYDGTVYVAWIDKRDMHAAQMAKQSYAGAAVYYAVSTDAGASFAKEFKASDHTCECCRIALAPSAEGNVVGLWRHVFDGGTRDHAIAVLTANGLEGKVRRASFGGWKIDACPHHGGALARGGDWGWHMAWFDGGERAGLFYARMDGEAWVSSPPKRFGSADAQASHPHLLSVGERVILVWREFSELNSAIWLMTSNDGGRSWGQPRSIAQTSGASDHPFLVADGETAFLSWNTAAGYRLIEIEQAAH
jgi:hypothetical protein